MTIYGPNILSKMLQYLFRWVAYLYIRILWSFIKNFLLLIFIVEHVTLQLTPSITNTAQYLGKVLIVWWLVSSTNTQKHIIEQDDYDYDDTII